MTTYVSTYMKTKYGENVLKDRGYNNPFKSLAGTAAAGGAAFAAFLVTTVADSATSVKIAETVANGKIKEAQIAADAVIEASRIKSEAVIKNMQLKLCTK
jgi:hypothetical protein